jgi:hypothetical protein
MTERGVIASLSTKVRAPTFLVADPRREAREQEGSGNGDGSR